MAKQPTKQPTKPRRRNYQAEGWDAWCAMRDEGRTPPKRIGAEVGAKNLPTRAAEAAWRRGWIAAALANESNGVQPERGELEDLSTAARETSAKRRATARAKLTQAAREFLSAHPVVNIRGTELSDADEEETAAYWTRLARDTRERAALLAIVADLAREAAHEAWIARHDADGNAIAPPTRRQRLASTVIASAPPCFEPRSDAKPN